MVQVMLKKQNKLKVNNCENNKICKNLPKQKSGQFNQILSGVVCVAGFLIIFIVMLFDAYSITESRTKYLEYQTDLAAYGYATSCVIVSNADCKIKCDGMDQNVLSKNVEAAFEKLKPIICKNKIILEVKNFWANDEILTPGWLNSTKFKLKQLSLSGSNINDIHPEAFNGLVFTDLEKLKLISLTILKLQKDLFEAKPKLAVFSMDMCRVVSIERESLKPVQYSLTTLEINNFIGELDPVNLTGSVSMYGLSSVDLRFNHILVNSKSFSSLIRCQALYLSYSNIDKIAPEAFKQLSSLELIHLNNNNLSTLNENMFPKRTTLSFHISENPWECDYRLQWLCKFTESIKDWPTCAEPYEKQDELIVDDKVCEVLTTELSTQTSTVKTTTTTEDLNGTTITLSTEGSSINPTEPSETTTSSEETTTATPTNPTKETTQSSTESTTVTPTNPTKETTQPSTESTTATSTNPTKETTQSSTESTTVTPTNPTKETTQPSTNTTEEVTQSSTESITKTSTIALSKPTEETSPNSSTEPSTDSSKASTGTIETTTQSSTEATTKNNTNIDHILVPCHGSNSIIINEIAKQSIDFNIKSNGPGKVSVEIGTEALKSHQNYFLVWFNKHMPQDNVDNINCRGEFEGYTLVEDLEFNDVYSFCLVEEGNNKISPLNCKPFMTEDVWENQLWLTKGDVLLVAIIAGIGFVCSWIFGGIGIFVLVRKNPTLLRGSKRVVIVKKRHTEAIVMPAKFKEKTEEYPSVFRKSCSIRGSFRRPFFRRSVSETSIMSGSYISPSEPTSTQLLTWRLERLRGKLDRIPPVADRPITPDMGNDYESISCVTEV